MEVKFTPEDFDQSGGQYPQQAQALADIVNAKLDSLGIAEKLKRLEELGKIREEPMHASAPLGFRCAECSIDKEPCPTCYATWWKNKHPNVICADLTEQQTFSTPLIKR